MQYGYSCGYVVYCENGDGREYLIIRSVGGGYGFPKGHIEPGETEEETADRELREETGLEVRRIPGFRQEVTYVLPSRPEKTKHCVFFLGQYTGGMLRCQETEVAEAAFLPLEKARALLPFANTRQVLAEAENFLNQSIE